MDSRGNQVNSTRFSYLSKWKELAYVKSDKKQNNDNVVEIRESFSSMLLPPREIDTMDRPMSQREMLQREKTIGQLHRERSLGNVPLQDSQREPFRYEWSYKGLPEKIIWSFIMMGVTGFFIFVICKIFTKT